MRLLKYIIKSFTCKHNFETVTNLHGDCINYFNGHRSIKRCHKCGKTKFDGLDPNCDIVNDPYVDYPEYKEKIKNIK